LLMDRPMVPALLIGHSVPFQICYDRRQRLRVTLLQCNMPAVGVVGGTVVTRQARIGRAAGGTAWATDGARGGMVYKSISDVVTEHFI
jgi:hypothetical protein